jgi:hypothetical protein
MPLRVHLRLRLRLATFSETTAWSFKWENYLNSLSNKTVTIFLDRQQKKKIHRCFILIAVEIFHNIIHI